jgi:hypothetical protein
MSNRMRAALAQARRCLRVSLRLRSSGIAPGYEWSVLDWNAPSIAFYQALGARAMDEWTIYRLDGAALSRLASAVENQADS